MERIGEKFERFIERFLSGNLDRRVRLLSWLTLFLLGVSLWTILLLLSYEIPLKDKTSGLSIHLPLKALLFEKNH